MIGQCRQVRQSFSVVFRVELQQIDPPNTAHNPTNNAKIEGARRFEDRRHCVLRNLPAHSLACGRCAMSKRLLGMFQRRRTCRIFGFPGRLPWPITPHNVDRQEASLPKGYGANSLIRLRGVRFLLPVMSSTQIIDSPLNTFASCIGRHCISMFEGRFGMSIWLRI